MALWPYLTSAGSLTEMLRTKAGVSFHVDVLSEAEQALEPEDAALLEVAPRSPGYVRQVRLCGPEPWVYARSITHGGGERWLKQLGDQPLGERVFAAPDARRGPIQIAHLHPGDTLFELAAEQQEHPPVSLWARRSVLQVGGAAILIYECFYPELGA